MQRGFLLGIGSNLEPEANVPRILQRLNAVFGEVWISSVQPTAPLGMDTQNAFLNFAAFVPTDGTAEALKPLLNQIEEGLGRDRTDPDKKIKDRTADIDILRPLDPETRLNAADLPPEAYLRPSCAELAVALGLMPAGVVPPPAPGVSLRLDHQIVGPAPARIRLDSEGRVMVETLRPR